VLDYHRPDWQTEVRRLAGGPVPVAVNAVRGAAPGLLSLVADGGRLATITNEPLQGERGINVSGFFVSPDGALLERQAASFAERPTPASASPATAQHDRRHEHSEHRPLCSQGDFVKRLP
jgi:NADPH:quinone reductase-like Zn-dependent oxidoreductase